MKPVIDVLESAISSAMATAVQGIWTTRIVRPLFKFFKRLFGLSTNQKDAAAIVRPAKDPKFGDYQANGVMALAKQLKTNPRELAQKVVNKLDLSGICELPEIAGPGFINLRLKSEFLSNALLEINDDKEHLGISKVDKPQRIVVDFSGPNIAKQMHVGHLRSTIIGDCICRVLEFLGHTVIRQNHIGDWGTQFGRVLLGLWHMCMAERHEDRYYHAELRELESLAEDKNSLVELCRKIRDRHEKDWREDSLKELGDGEKYFKPFLVKIRNSNPDDVWHKFLMAYQYVNVLEECVTGMGLKIPTRQAGTISYESLSRHITTMVQNNKEKLNEQEGEAWKFIRNLTLEKCNQIYEKLNVILTNKHVKGESEYNEDLPKVVAELKQKGLAVESEGAVCVFPEGFKNKEGEPLPLIVQKSDGAYLYATTDLAAIRYRVNELKADEIIYVTDARQQLHFEMVFKVAEMAGWAKKDMLHHVTFGSVLGEDGKPFKTRAGDNIQLEYLLEQAEINAENMFDEKNPDWVKKENSDLSVEQRDKIADAVGIGAVKYADYSNNRTSDYVFSFDKMLAMDGNTAPYMQYAYARIKSIERKSQSKDVDIETELAGIKELNLTEPDELDLAKHLVRYGEVIESAAVDYRPNYLTSYLYELAQKFSGFYTNCPVLKAELSQRPTRLLLCDLTARTIEHGLHELLGIEVVEQM